jgi:CBS domain-containing protein
VRAHDIATTIRIVRRDQSVAEASQALADSGKTGLVVADEAGHPVGVITVLDVVRLALPEYLVDDPSLAAMLDEQSIHDVVAPLRNKTLAEVIADKTVRLRDLPDVDPDATMLEIAAVLVGSGCAVAALAGSAPSEPRFVTLPAVLQAVLADGSGVEPA